MTELERLADERAGEVLAAIAAMAITFAAIAIVGVVAMAFN